ncbi:MAG TPA: tRNA preQ1(34) S-adenosylmethionine ribosyltransferase-isomerase QueA [Candidatus Saccharimonadales bacterium]|nr:tRNA preQ1(34) S-adenosylmethionine ribosyltransferase-isomerase QueA [Candidatus Saccharimonadales bacterium]
MLSDFDFELPAGLIAQRPVRPRDHARLLVYNRKTRRIIDEHFYNLDKYLVDKTSLVLNDSKVEKCRLGFGSTEVFVLETLDNFTVRALVRPGKEFLPGKTTRPASALRVETLAVDADGVRTLKLSKELGDPDLDKYRQTPLPPYIKPDESLAADYQTVYARAQGSKAAPTAGLHFTRRQLAELGGRFNIIRLTLHVGLGTFAPVKSDDISQHKMHSEDYFLSAKAASQLNKSSHLTAVGTTSLRCLESINRPFTEASGSTDIFITPGYKFKNVDSLVTNFHLPRSTLLMLVAAFLGSVDELHKIYQHAITQKYRFYSFGDAMLII